MKTTITIELETKGFLDLFGEQKIAVNAMPYACPNCNLMLRKRFHPENWGGKQYVCPTCKSDFFESELKTLKPIRKKRVFL